MSTTRKPVVRVYPPGYGPVYTHADYRPLDTDGEFQAIRRGAAGNTMVDEYRLWELWRLAGQMGPIAGDFLEIGTWRGGSAAVLARSIQRLAPTRHLYIADTFQGVAKAGDRDSYYTGGEHADTALETVRSFLHNQRLDNFTLLPGVFPEETGDRIADVQFAFCHIDVDVYQSARDALEFVWPRMGAGSVVVFDDYGFYGCDGVTQVVDELRSRNDLLILENLNGHAIVIKR